jgi:hypothetical protein
MKRAEEHLRGTVEFFSTLRSALDVALRERKRRDMRETEVKYPSADPTPAALRTASDSFADFLRARQSGDIRAAMSALEETLDLDPAHSEARQQLEMLFCAECGENVNWRGLSTGERKKFWAGQCPKCKTPLDFQGDRGSKQSRHPR